MIHLGDHMQSLLSHSGNCTMTILASSHKTEVTAPNQHPKSYTTFTSDASYHTQFNTLVKSRTLSDLLQARITSWTCAVPIGYKVTRKNIETVPKIRWNPIHWSFHPTGTSVHGDRATALYLSGVAGAFPSDMSEVLWLVENTECPDKINNRMSLGSHLCTCQASQATHNERIHLEMETEFEEVYSLGIQLFRNWVLKFEIHT